MQSHQFALYVPTPLPEHTPSMVTLTEPNLCHRVVHVLRMQPGDQLLLFTDALVYSAQLASVQPRKGGVLVNLHSAQPITLLQPKINLYVGLAKKEAFEDVAYAAAQLGAQNLYPVLFGKVQRRWSGDKERDRLQGIMIGACEQAKQFALPTLHEPISFAQLHTHSVQGNWIYFTPQGKPLKDLIREPALQKVQSLSLVIGPEGGLSPDEEEQLAAAQVHTCALTPSILRTRDMGLVVMGIVRTFW